MPPPVRPAALLKWSGKTFSPAHCEEPGTQTASAGRPLERVAPFSMVTEKSSPTVPAPSMRAPDATVRVMVSSTSAGPSRTSSPMLRRKVPSRISMLQ